MRWIKCVWTCADSGAEGLVPNIFRDWYESKDYGGYSPSTRLAHDLMAHGIKEFGTVADELKALGAELYIREFWQGNYSSESLRSDIQGTLSDAFAELPQMAKKVRLSENDAHEIRYMLKNALSEAVESATEYPVDWGLEELCELPVEEQEPAQKKQAEELFSPENIEIMYSWLAYGFSCAKKRYQGQDVWFLYQAINEKLKNLQLEEGQTFSIGYCWKTDRIETREHYNY